MCGAGTTIIEATHLSSGITAYGSDRSLTTINCAKENWGAAFPHINHNLFVADVLDFPIQRSFATKFITNLPWGRQVTLESSLSLYDSYFKLILKLGTNNFVSAVLTDRTEDFLEGLRLNPNIHLLWGLQFSLLGSYPYLYILGGPHWLEKKEALNQISPLGERIITLIERKGVLQRYSLSK